MDEQIKLLIDEINAWCHKTELYTWLTVFHLCGKNKFNVLNHSTSPGLGKSHGSKNLIEFLWKNGTEELHKNNIHLMIGKFTPKRFYQELKDFKEAHIVIDESSNLLRSQDIVDMLKDALYSGNVGWKTTRDDDHDDDFKFSGSLIFNTNSFGKNNDVRAIRDRCYYTNLNLTVEEHIEKRKQARVYTPNTVIWTDVKKRIKKAQKSKVTLTQEEADKVEAFVDKQLLTFGKSYKVASQRCWHRTGELFLRAKKFFGELDEETFSFLEKMSQPLIVPDNPINMVFRIMENHENKVEKIKLVREFAEASGYSERNARRIIDSHISDGVLKSDNRVVTV